MEGVNHRETLPTATVADTALILTDVVIPTVAKGPIIRRRKMLAMAERLGLDSRAVRRMQKLESKYGAGPLMVRIPRWSRAVVLAPEHVHRVLEETPEPFATASDEKRAALSHFEPRNVLISHGPERAVRRRLNDDVLEAYQPVHHLADRFVEVVGEESDALLGDGRGNGQLCWERFFDAWFRVVRRVVFGDSARDDHELTDLVFELRRDANWAFLKPKRKAVRRRFFEVLESRLSRAEPDSLGAMIIEMASGRGAEPLHQVPQWLFAFDPAGMATFRALALLATHPEQLDNARREIAEDTSARRHLPFLRASVLESLRLWPTSPMVLRQSTSETAWEAGTMPRDTGILIFAPYFHRDDRNLPYANRFAPGVWLEDRGADGWPLVPFSGGPAFCPGTWIVQLLTSAMLASLIDGRDARLVSHHRLRPNQPLPGTLNHFSLRFEITSETG